MDKPQVPATTQSQTDDEVGTELPPGNHALEVAARRGIGPLSTLGHEVWHGHARPCVSCGQLVRRDAQVCGDCGQDLSEAMLEKMRAHAGPWYVVEHVRPFPGVSLERIIRQIRRGLITEASIVRGPSTDFQWRFAVESPGLCRYFGRCWRCHAEVSPSDTYCQHCLSYLSFERPPTQAASPPPPGPAPSAAGQSRETVGQSVPTATGSGVWRKVAGAPLRQVAPPTPAVARTALTPADELRQLSAAVGKAELPTHDAVWEEPPRIGGVRATWVAVGLLIVVIAALIFLTESRTQTVPPPRPIAPGLVPPIWHG